MYKLIQVREGKHSYEMTVPAGSTLDLVLISLHVRRADITVRVRLTGTGARAMITGVVVGDNEGKIAIHTMQMHEAADTTSDLLVKTILSGHAACLYDGGIFVSKRAQKTDAYQRNENLLLSDKAYAESKPSLEILANDVRCTHGATAGPINADELWYLASRGIPRPAGKRLITMGFIESALERVEDGNARTHLQRLFAKTVV